MVTPTIFKAQLKGAEGSLMSVTGTNSFTFVAQQWTKPPTVETIGPGYNPGFGVSHHGPNPAIFMKNICGDPSGMSCFVFGKNEDGKSCVTVYGGYAKKIKDIPIPFSNGNFYSSSFDIKKNQIYASWEGSDDDGNARSGVMVFTSNPSNLEYKNFIPTRARGQADAPGSQTYNENTQMLYMVDFNFKAIICVDTVRNKEVDQIRLDRFPEYPETITTNEAGDRLIFSLADLNTGAAKIVWFNLIDNAYDFEIINSNKEYNLHADDKYLFAAGNHSVGLYDVNTGDLVNRTLIENYAFPNPETNTFGSCVSCFRSNKQYEDFRALTLLNCDGKHGEAITLDYTVVPPLIR